ncbi:MAG: hypothetical protein A3B10_04130 [Candidatus Doudnabacteria bacterium RIFCSPLOWO2_01_FULL_44_21]|uniref:DNA 3'-5' helicase n=1 Tax=Candidatus Doudnabacteria bacterium RIFCSPLOWO2_01_FULL_44_21 TaxID=1817841 RepID=A0A1F5Q568_9BACT|nr:MAG: hypothetical protein A3B95_00360 [Candidatus Doudnabacteria bacterium RIFCSPHIGHO2_02_FULL_43_13b]OGE97303.1 MAG: hypothetical protein A3B10_04130 [Candidatus Doudnabacteria bacterium RIFCSPLOWO2_01_FULL_44_21]
MKANLGLNSAQLEAVTAPLGPVLILAGAGSGKTRALTMRIVYLIKKLKFNPINILAVTFTNKAAGEMKNRIIRLIGKSEQLPTMGTFHSIGVKILRAEGNLVGLNSNFVIYDNDDQESLLKDILLDFKLDPIRYKPNIFAGIIDRSKNDLSQPEDKLARKIYDEYQSRLLKNNAVDFGDLLVWPVRIFQKHPKVLKKYQELWRYILVDEYQDTNHVQYKFCQLLAAAHRNIFVVGDDAQAIYGFRGANLQNILDFEDDYPESIIVRLEQNYRSTAPILSIAEKIIELNPKQHKKRLWTQNLTGETPVLFVAEDELAESYFVAGKILEIQDPPSLRLRRAVGNFDELEYTEDDSVFARSPDSSGRRSNLIQRSPRLAGGEARDDSEGILSRLMQKFSSRVLPKLKNRQGLNNIAILYRTHVQSRVLEEVMIESSIPYQIVGGLKFYERKEIKDVLSYLRLLVNPNDLISLKRVINVPPRGIGPASFDVLKNILLTHSRESGNLGKIPDQVRDGTVKPQIKNFFEMLSGLTKLEESANLLDLLKQILKLSGYETFLRDGSEEGESRWENVQELFNVAASFKNLPWRDGLNQFLEEIALMTQADEVDLDSPKITLMTLHQAKGLEFETVFMVGIEEGILPHARSLLEPKEIAEEIRLAYVGVTRAKKRLFLIYAQSRKQFGSRNLSVPSRILKAIPEEMLKIEQGGLPF